MKKDHPGFVESVKEMQIELKYEDIIGHPDYVCVEKDGWGIADLKCTSGIRFKNFIQGAQYARMLMAIRGWPFPSFIRVIRLSRDKDKPTEWQEIKEPERISYCMGLFDHYLGIFNSEKILKEYFRSQAEDQLLGDW